MSDEPFALALNCVDGRVQRPLLRWIDDALALDRVDTITLPGPDATLLDGGEEGDRARRHATFLAERRHHACVIVAGHHDCLGNPVDEAEHLRGIERAADVVHGWALCPRTLGVWIDHEWRVRVVTELRDDGGGG
jgi:hypothetical protein